MLCLALAACLLAPQDPPPVRDDAPPDDRFEKRVLVRGLARPMEFEVAPDGTIFLIELAGQVSVYEPDSATLRGVLEVEVFAEQENGLIGLALDPNFAQTPWVYLLYSPPDLVGQRLARFDWDGASLTNETVLFEFEEQRRECCHHAGSMEFGPDGCLFISTGDNTHPHGDSDGYAPIDERPDRFPWDAQRSSANTAVYGGKILRLRPLPDGTVEIPEGNLFPKGEGGQPEIYAMGCRNQWRIGVDQKTGYVYWGEVGPDAGGDGPRGPRGYDEVNQAREAGNFGWPLFIADNKPYAYYDYTAKQVGAFFDPARPVNRSVNNTGAKVLPPAQPAWIYYPYGDSDVFPQLNAGGGRSACAGPVYDFEASALSATKLPEWFDRGLFIFEWSRHWIQVVHLDENSDIASITPLPGGFSFKRPVDIDIAPDGTLYVLEYGTTWNDNADSALVRIDYHAGNRPPRARASVEPNMGGAPLAVTLSAEGSVDLDGDDVTYRWKGPDGKVLGEGATLATSIEVLGEHTLELEAIDPSGAVGRASVGVLVGNTPPAVTLSGLRDGGFYDPGNELKWQLWVEDEEDGTPSEGDPEWWVARSAVRAEFHAGPPPSSRVDDTHPAVAHMLKSDCFNCHAVDRRVVGPAFEEIATKYRGDDEALERAVQRVRDGSAEVWGSQPMLPHSDLAPEVIREMVEWVLALTEEEAGATPTRAFNGSTGTDPVANGAWVIDASWEDGGGELETIPTLVGDARLVVRSRRVEGEHASHLHGTSILNSESASGGAFLGNIQPNNHMRLDGVDLTGIGKVRISVSSAGAGGTVELRVDSPDGPLLASYMVKVNGEWEAWYQLEEAITPPEGMHDLFVVFRQRDRGGALMNLDWVEFHRGGTGTVEGEVKFAGPVPVPTTASRQQLQGIEGFIPYQPIRVDGQDGLRDVVLQLRGVPSKPPRHFTPHRIHAKSGAYQPQVSAVRAGVTLEIFNKDQVSHNTRTVAAKTDGPGSTLAPNTDHPLSIQTRVPDLIELSCDIHPWMNGYVVVLDHPFFAVTDSLGRFRIFDIPPGKYDLDAWHPTLGDKKLGKVQVDANGVTTIDFSY